MSARASVARAVVFAVVSFIASCGLLGATEPPFELAHTIDQRIESQLSKDQATDLLDDDGFIRRVTLDLAGRVPTAAELEQYRSSARPDKRKVLVQRLIESPDFAFHQRNELDTLLLRRLEHDDAWREYLLEATQENRAWDELFREIMLPEHARPEDPRPATYLSKRAQDLDAMANDSSIIWFGVNVACAKCHDHPLVWDWTQSHYYGLARFFKRTFKSKKGFVGERFDGQLKYETTAGEEFDADFMFLTGTKVKEPELQLEEAMLKEHRAAIKKAERDEKAPLPPRPEFSPRAELIEVALADTEQQFFARNIVNRVWARLFGRGLVHPLDQMHSENPASHPELLELLSQDLIAHRYDLKRTIHGIVLSDAYTRRMAPAGSGAEPPPDLFAAAIPRPLSPHQYSLSLRIATSNPQQMQGLAGDEDWKQHREKLERQSEGIARRLEIPSDSFQVSVTEALWFSNNPEVENQFLGSGRNQLIGHLVELDSDEEVVRAATRSTLTRDPDQVEVTQMTVYLHARAHRREEAIRHIVWALLSSPEFRFNH